MAALPILRPLPAPSARPWAGDRLGDGVGELWLAGPDSLVDVGDGTPRTLDELAAIHGVALVGTNGMARLGARFPLLTKVIDAHAWLSLQVHPSDELAASLFGPGTLGKTEAWVVLDAAPGALLITGPSRSLDEARLRDAIGSGTMGQPECDEHPGRPGDAWFLRAGTIHAIGPGLLVFEIEEPSDLTFRISDWGRPATAARPLHTHEALLAVRPRSHALPSGFAWRLDGGELRVPEFRLELVSGPGTDRRRPGDRTLEIVTALRGRVVAVGDGWREILEPYETLVVPASMRAYSLEPESDAVAAVGSVPGRKRTSTSSTTRSRTSSGVSTSS